MRASAAWAVPGGQELLPRAAPRRHDEDVLQRSVVQFLRVALPDRATYHAIPNGGLRSRKAAARLVGQGVVAGTPDLEIVIRGLPPLYIELKTPRGALSLAQRQRHAMLRHCGAGVFVCRSVEDVEAALREACVPLRGRAA